MEDKETPPCGAMCRGKCSWATWRSRRRFRRGTALTAAGTILAGSALITEALVGVLRVPAVVWCAGAAGLVLLIAAQAEMLRHWKWFRREEERAR